MSIFGNFSQNNQQQQQQQQPNAFGQPSGGFGTPSGFGAFGQNTQPPQQPQVNPMFGNLTAPSTSTTGTGGFGAFANASNSAFGQPRPAFGSTGTPSAFGGGQPSAFGSSSGTGAFGSGGAFGGSSAGGAFGQTTSQPQQSTFGSSSSLFKPQGTGFGSSALVPAAASIPTSGTANPSYSVTQERDQNNVLHYQSITCMPAYRSASFEELRVQDYQQNRKTPNSSSFGAPGGFSQPAQAPGSVFGQAQPAAGFGAFGQQQQQQQQQQPQQPQPQPQQSAFGAFGQQNQQQQQPSGAFGAFGQQNQQQNPTGFGAFGQQQQQQQQPSASFGAFAQQNKPFGAFGQPQNNPSGFGAFGSNTTTNTSAFGQTQQPQQSAFGAFGQQNQNPLMKPSVFSQPSTGGAFGQQQQGSGFGTAGQQPSIFGGNTGQQQSAFGQPVNQPQQQSTGLFGGQPAQGNLFGNANQNQQQNQQQAPGSGFGSLFTRPAGTGIFGTPTNQQNQPAQNPNPNNPLFGGGGGLFSSTNTNTQQQQQQPQPSSTNPLFGGVNPGSLFGGKPPAPSNLGGLGNGGGLFGSTGIGPQQQAPGLGGSIFGASTTQPSQQQGSSLFGGSLFGSTATQPTQQQQPTLTPSLDQPLPSTLPTLPPLASSTSPHKKKSNVFADTASRTTPRLGFGHSSGLSYAPPSSGPKLRGFGASISTAVTEQQSSKAKLPFGESKGLLSPEAFSSGAGGSLQLLGGARQSVKKLVLNKRADEDDLHRMRTKQGGDTTPAREVRFNPALGVAAREKDHEGGTATKPSTPKATPPADTPAAKVANGPLSSLDPQEGEYWCLPTVTELQRLSFSELQVVKDFTVGRVGYGTIQFIQPVDLTSVPSIADIPGKVVSFEHMECTLYTDERLRPPPGEGLNVPARIKLDRCWAIDKSTRAPIKDPKDAKYQQRVRKMQSQDGAEFVSFDAETGVWEFIVKEF